jgi:hypothetical protein
MERRRQQTKSPTDSILTGLTDASYQAFRPHWLVSEQSLFRTRGDPQGFPATNPKQVCSVIACSVRTREEALTDHDAIASSFAARARMAASPSLARHVSSFAGRRRGHASQAVRCRWSARDMAGTEVRWTVCSGMRACSPRSQSCSNLVGKYHMIPNLAWYHIITIFPNSILSVSYFLKKI